VLTYQLAFCIFHLLTLELVMAKLGFGSGMRIFTLGNVTAEIVGCRSNGVQRLRLGEVGEFNPQKPIRITNVQ